MSAQRTQGVGLGEGAGQAGPGLLEGTCSRGHTGSVCT